MKPRTQSLTKTAGNPAPGPSPGFGQHAADWWDINGPMAPLHRLNPARLTYIKDVVCRTLGRAPDPSRPLAGVTALDIGCGGGLVTEPLTRLGVVVTGIDTSPDLIQAAADHAAAQNLKITYEAILSDALAARTKRYDVITALEVIEHVDDPEALLRDIAKLLRPGGVAILSTPNRTTQSYLKTIVAAEYIMGWVPRGTHQWSRFIKPSELAALAQQVGLQAVETMGLHYQMPQRDFTLAADKMDVNYFMVLRHA